jgi:hypothetical protein
MRTQNWDIEREQTKSPIGRYVFLSLKELKSQSKVMETCPGGRQRREVNSLFIFWSFCSLERRLGNS